MKKNYYLNFGVIIRVVLPPTLFLVLINIIFHFSILPSHKEGILKEKKDSIITLTQIATSTIDFYRSEILFDPQIAKEKAILALKRLRYGKNAEGYFWVVDTNGLILMHPNQDEMIGHYIEETMTKEVLSSFSNLLSQTKRNGEAFANYPWKKYSSDSMKSPKFSYAKLYPKWNWIIGTGFYLDDLQLSLKEQEEKFFSIFLSAIIASTIITLILIILGIKKERQLILLEREAQIANRAKRLFMAKVGHELRTPLNQIWGASSLLEPSKNQTIIQKATKLLLGHIDDITTYVSIDNKSIKPFFEAITFEELESRIFELWNGVCLERQIKLNISLSDKRIKGFKSDQKFITIVLNSLVSNAIKFSKENNTIDITIDRVAPDRIKFSVKDYGIGINKNLRPKIWDEFLQLDENLDRCYPGLGIGLPLAKKIVIRLKGKIDFESSQEGSNFYFTIPVSDITLHGQESESKNQKIKNANVLLVDDDESNLLLLGSFLKNMNIRHSCAMNGIDAIEHFKNEEFDLVLMDIQMPKLDGLEATKSIRAWEKEKNRNSTPIIAVSAFTSNEAKYSALNAGMTDFLEKPILKNKLQQLLSDYSIALSDAS